MLKLLMLKKKQLKMHHLSLKRIFKRELITKILRRKHETLVQASMKLGEAIYKSQEKKPGSSADGSKK